jgi:hypothetical protein
MQQHECGTELVKINGRTLREFSKKTLGELGAKQQFGKSSVTDWVSICPNCNAYALGVDTQYPCAFLCADGVMRTMRDFDWGRTNTFTPEFLDFYGFKFSSTALYSYANISMNEQKTCAVEVMGSALSDNLTPDAALAFSDAVVDWGRGGRVWGNLKRFHADNLGNQIHDWILELKQDKKDEEAIAHGINIKGLGVSFASKHLRMLNPEKYAVLDEVLSNGLGIALNEKGYALFMRLLRDFKEAIGFEHSIAILEMAIFNLVRQQVRSSP